MARRLRPVELDFLDSAPVRLVFTTTMRARPAAVYQALAEDVTAWGTWFPAVSWARPTHGGAGREIKLRAGVRFGETILAADPAERYAYRVDTTNAPGVTALLEEWRIDPGGDGSRVRWVFATDGPPPVRRVLRLLRPGLGRSFRSATRNLDRRLGPPRRPGG
ncbi:SRPBCC family protein [Streptomyces sp. NPDC057638]|uniref:SRPBCC family protein n=1 Tax=Streptomyces sp. NPDC057638 TaxID=3346190 RepID=UPI0036B9F5B5